MANTHYNSDGIIVIDTASETISGPFFISHILVSGSTAGTFTIRIGNALVSLITTSTRLNEVLPINRKVKSIAASALPSGGLVTVFIVKHAS